MSDKAAVEAPASAASQLSLEGVLRIPVVRQIVLLAGVALSVGVGFAAVLWLQSPGYARLYTNLDITEADQVAEALRGAGIEYKLDTDVGLVMVAEDQLHQARLELASQGLALGSGGGMEMLEGQSTFGVSQFRENALYQHALESELATTISSIGAVRSARVHLAIPRQASFIRDRNTASASVLLELGRGMQLESDQASAIVNIVASSIPNLSPGDVTLVDQYGRQLSESGSEKLGAQVGDQLRYTQQLEESYKRRIEQLLTPIVGPGRVRAEVVANLDFTITEETRESFNPEQTVVRSEQINEEESRGSTGSAAQGIPGPASNQPAQQAPIDAAAQQGQAAESESVNTTRSATRNFEVDRTISRVQPSPGRIQRLSVAILIDDVSADAIDAAPQTDGEATAEPDGAAEPQRTGLSQADIAQLTALVRNAVGFDEARGDTIEISIRPFMEIPEGPELEAPPIWENPLVMDIARLVLAAVVALALGFGLLRPMFRGILATGSSEAMFALEGSGVAGPVGPGQLGSSRLAIAPPSYEDKVTAAKNITNSDPARVAQVVRKWVTENA